MIRDPARTTLDWALADVRKRIQSSTQGILRGLSGGKSWSHEYVRRYRSELERALLDSQLVRTALADLDRMDAEIAP